jgi:hypothetical protein
MKLEFINEEVSVIRRALRFALDMGEDTYFAFFPDADDYSDGDQDKDEAARVVAKSLIDRLPAETEPDEDEEEISTFCGSMTRAEFEEHIKECEVCRDDADKRIDL